MSAPAGFGSQDLHARDFASLAPLGVDNLGGAKCFYDKAWLIFRASRSKPVVRINPEASGWCISGDSQR